MALPRRRQQLAKFIPFHDLTLAIVAETLGADRARVHNLCWGNAYPSPSEIAALERLFGLPVEVLFEPAMLVYRGTWPPPKGAAAAQSSAARAAIAQMSRDRHESGD